MNNDFYGTSKGDSLVCEENYPQEIQNYLNEEQNKLVNTLINHRILVEVGCMEGRNATVAIENKKAYLGIDIIDSYILDAKQRYIGKNKVDFQVESAENLDLVQKRLLNNFAQDQILYFFPFNSFGNMDNVKIIAEKINKFNLNVFISTYKTDLFTNQERKHYYQNCQMKNLEMQSLPKGIVFSSDDGLNAKAYKKEFVAKLFADSKSFAWDSLGKIGMCYMINLLR